MRQVSAHDLMTWVNLLSIFIFYYWRCTLLQSYVTSLEYLSRCLSHRVIFWWLTGICLLSYSHCLIDSFSFLILFCLPYTKYYKLVWYIYRKRNLVKMQHYSFAIFPFDYGDDVSNHKFLDTPLLRSWPWTESTSLSFPLMLRQRALFTFLTSLAKRGLGVRDFILWS